MLSIHTVLVLSGGPQSSKPKPWNEICLGEALPLHWRQPRQVPVRTPSVALQDKDPTDINCTRYLLIKLTHELGGGEKGIRAESVGLDSFIWDTNRRSPWSNSLTWGACWKQAYNLRISLARLAEPRDNWHLELNAALRSTRFAAGFISSSIFFTRQDKNEYHL